MTKSRNLTNQYKNRNANLDLVRFCAATLVLFSHSYPLSGRNSEEPFARITGYETGGGIAVSVFFIISGYLITASYLKGSGPLDYIKKRAYRIFPALFVAVLVTIFLGAIITPMGWREYFIHSQTVSYLKNIYLNIQYNLPLVFSNNTYPNAVNGSLWTLPVEVFMYGVILLLGVLGGLKDKFVVILMGLFLALYLFGDYYPFFSQFIFLGAAPLILFFKLGSFFFLGAFFYLYKEKIPLRADLSVLFVIIIFLTFRTKYGEMAYLILSPYLVFYFSTLNVSFLANFGRYGDFSYGIYIYAFPIQQTVMHVTNGPISVPVFVALSFIPTLLVAIISWKFIEEPALKHARKRRDALPAGSFFGRKLGN